MQVNIQILNKNNNASYTANEDVIFTDNYNETLDSMNLKLAHLSSEIDIEPFDKVVVIFSNNNTVIKTKYYCVNTYSVRQDTIGIDNAKYTYDISLFSETKELEGVLCPNLTITPLKTGTKRSVWDYLQHYLNLYGNKVRSSTGWRAKWRYNSDTGTSVETKFDAIECPEMQWNQPTLREVITDLMMVADCIPTMSNNIISYIDLTKKNDPITNFNYLEKSQSADNYVSELKMDMQNVLQTQINGIRNTSTTIEYIKLSSNDYLITSENIHLKTTFPILNVKHLWMTMITPPTTDTQETNGKIYTVDLMNFNTKNFVKEYQQYITLPVAYRTTQIAGGHEDEYQNYNLYFNRGSNTITGFTNISKGFLWTTTDTLNLLKDYMFEAGYSEGFIPTFSGRSHAVNTYFSTLFKIEYETTTDQVFSASKDKVKNKRVVMDNQTNSWVDAYSQGFLEYQKANRLGNQVVMFNQRVSSLANAIQIGDYYGDVVIYQTQYQIYSNHIEVNAYGTKDYILRNYWTGINSKIRTWVNARDEAMIRHELEKYYCQLSFNAHDEKITLTEDVGGKIAKFIQASTDNTSTMLPIQYSALKTTTASGNQPVSNSYIYSKELISRIIGNSYVFTTGFDDNYEAGRKIDSEITTSAISNGEYGGDGKWIEPRITSGTVQTTNNVSGIPTEPMKYTDNNGEFETLQTILFTNVVEEQQTGNSLTPTQYKNVLWRTFQKPLLDTTKVNGEAYNESKTYYKDNKEIFKVSYQFEIYTDESDLFFTKYLLANNPIIFDSQRSVETLVYAGTGWREDGELPANAQEIQDASLSIARVHMTNSTTRIDVVGLPEQKNIFICDENGKVMVGIKANKLAYDSNTNRYKVSFYLNILLDRDLSIYDANNFITGEI